MSVKKYNFVSPGIFLEEIDNSQLPNIAPPVGPVVIGRTEKGPAMRPVTVGSFSEFVETFGNPIPGGQSGDVWRDGNYTSPTYAAYAAQAWLKNSSPLTVVRLLGHQHENKTSAGKAGWTAGAISLDVAGGAYGLFLVDTTFTGSSEQVTPPVASQPMSAALAAVFYTPTAMDCVVGLTGSPGVIFDGSSAGGLTDAIDGLALKGGQNVVLTASGGDFYMRISSSLNDAERIRFNFDRNSDRYIRKVFNTNPALTNTTTAGTGSRKGYWLGETFDRFIGGGDVEGGFQYTPPATLAAAVMALKINVADGAEFADKNFGAKSGRTGWFFGQDLGSYTAYDAAVTSQKLFRFHGRDGGEWLQNNVKISIMDVKPSQNKEQPWGSFTVALRKIFDRDTTPQYLERFTNCNLNPNSTNYVARRIGDAYTLWSDTERAYKNQGTYGNQSRYIRVEMMPDVDKGAVDPTLVPFGFYGHPKYTDALHVSGAQFAASLAASHYGSSLWPTGGVDQFAGGFLLTASHTQTILATPNTANTICPTASYYFPQLALRFNGVEGNTVPKKAFWGVSTMESGSTRFDASCRDVIRALPAEMEEGSTGTETAFFFSLDNLVATSDNNIVVYASGSRKNGTSLTATRTNGYSRLLNDERYGRFTTLFHGGFDGFDIAEREPLRNTKIKDGTESGNYAFYTIKRAIDTIADPEVVEMNLATIPGLTNPALTAHLINTCENRADALAIIDLENDYVPNTENNLDDSSNIGDVSGAVSALKNRGINSSYGCSYYPWVLARDTINDSILWLPPSVAGLGTMANSERAEALWFAPAGFTRGGLTQGAAGIPIVGTRQQLTQNDRDTLYDANVNPIATFPNEGIVVFGQKTLQVVPSALDRINVRRLLIFVKKEMSRIAATTLFEPNVEATWDGFSARAENLLQSIKGNFGLDDFKVILDETTTTPELIDRNIMYAKVFLKPTKAIEFIALDFVVTDSGASFAD